MTNAAAVSLRKHQRLVWGLCYRMTGSAADADDLVQETYVRALEKPPKDEATTRAWLVKVAVNLARDQLRKRKRERYRGPWLPSPIPEEEEPPAFEAQENSSTSGTEGRYDMMESASFAFLVALEALTPMQRAVLLLTEVLDYSTEETSRALGITASNVKTTHHRARRALSEFEATRKKESRESLEKNRALLQEFLTALATGDAASMEKLLAHDAIAIHDAGGEFVAAGRALVGREMIAKAMSNIARTAGPLVGAELRVANGLVWVVGNQIPRAVRDGYRAFPSRWALAVEAGPDGAIARVFLVVAKKKLARIAP